MASLDDADTFRRDYPASLSTYGTTRNSSRSHEPAAEPRPYAGLEISCTHLRSVRPQSNGRRLVLGSGRALYARAGAGHYFAVSCQRVELHAPLRRLAYDASKSEAVHVVPGGIIEERIAARTSSLW